MLRRKFLGFIASVVGLAGATKAIVKAAPPDLDYGTGRDGDFVLDRPTAIARDMHYRNLTVLPGGRFVYPDERPRKIFVQGTFDISRMAPIGYSKRVPTMQLQGFGEPPG